QLWDSATRKPFGEPLRHDYAVFAVAFSPDGTKVLTGSIDKTARLWDPSTGKPLDEPLRHDGHVLAVAFSPAGTTALTGSDDKTARSWDAATGKALGKPIRIGTVAVPRNADAAVEHRGLVPDNELPTGDDLYPTNVLPTSQLEKWLKDAKTNVIFVCDT